MNSFQNQNSHHQTTYRKKTIHTKRHPEMKHSQSENSSKVPELRLVLLGRTGAGKSATGNTILGKTTFDSQLSMSSVTNKCQRECGVVQGQKLVLIDTPGYFDTSEQPGDVQNEILRCMAMCSPGPHAFLLIIPIARFTNEQQQTLEMIKEVFEENITSHTIIIFTRADELEGKPIEQFISQQDKRIQDVVEQFGSRFLAFNNKNPENQDQVTDLLQKLDEMLVQNEYRHFINEKTQTTYQKKTIPTKQHPEMKRCQSENSSKVPELRLVLLGRTGAGKSATGNTILGKTTFDSQLSMSSVTKICQRECGVVQGQKLVLIDTPGYFDTSEQPGDVQNEILRCMAMCSPGPHAFLLIIPIARFTNEQQQTLEMIKEVFQENITSHTIIIFTHADELEGKPIEQFISEQDKRIQNVVEQFGSRFLAFNNKNPENQDQVIDLLQKLDEMLVQNEYRHFINEKTQVMEKALALLTQKTEERIAEAIAKAKQEVQKMGEHRYANNSKALKEETQEIERRRKHTQGKINKLTSEIRKEQENQHADPRWLQRMQKYLQRENDYLKRLEEDKRMRIKESEEEQEELEIWIKEEVQKREQEEREKYDGSKWYYNEFYFTILKYVMCFVGGAGFLFMLGPAAFLAPAAAPVGLAAELTALLGPELAAMVMAACTKLGPFVGVATKAAPLVTSLCSIQ